MSPQARYEASRQAALSPGRVVVQARVQHPCLASPPRRGFITTHVLRHTAASLWIKAGATPFLVMKAGGWSSLDMGSSVYGHLWPSDVAELGRKVDALDWDALD